MDCSPAFESHILRRHKKHVIQVSAISDTVVLFCNKQLGFGVFGCCSFHIKTRLPLSLGSPTALSSLFLTTQQQPPSPTPTLLLSTMSGRGKVQYLLLCTSLLLTVSSRVAKASERVEPSAIARFFVTTSKGLLSPQFVVSRVVVVLR